MSDLLASFWRHLLIHLWQASLYLGLLLLLERGLRKAPARVIHALWMTGLVRLLLPLHLLQGRFTEVTGRSITLPGASAVEPVLSPAPALAAIKSGGSSTMETVLIALTLVWAATAAFLFGRLARDLLLSRRGSGMPLAACRIREAVKLSGICESLGVMRKHVRISGERLMPGVTGIFRPRIIIPAALASALDDDEMAAILLHEENHRKRRDPLRALAGRLTHTLLHFYPPLYPLLRRLHETAEFACDEKALYCGISPDTYAKAFTRTLRLGLEPAGLHCAAAGKDGKLLRKRFTRILDFRRYEMTFWSKTTITIALLALLAGSILPAATAADDAKKPEHGDIPPELIESSGPEYPKEALKYKYTATVILKVTVDEKGDVAHAEALELAVFSNDKDGREIKTTKEENEKIYKAFEKSSLLAVYKWKFKPGTIGGKPAKVEVKIPVKFRLE
jgi:D-alanyl-D-alanine endopeptidase (penicillin-binding protein 7)